MPAVGIIRRQGFRMMFTAGCGKRIARSPFSSVRQLPVRTALRLKSQRAPAYSVFGYYTMDAGESKEGNRGNLSVTTLLCVIDAAHVSHAVRSYS